VTAPEAVGVTLPTEAQLATTVKTATSRRVDPYVDVDTGQSLMDAQPKPGTIVKTTPRPGGVTEWTLSNGATVVLKPTTLKEDQILFRATAPGGTSLASDADFVAARSADDVIGVGGVGRFNDTTLDRMLSGKAVAVVPYFGEISEGLTGGSTPQDLETMFQLLYLRFTAPRADPAAFAALVQQRKGLLANQMASPDVVFSQTLYSALSRDHRRRQPETLATVDQWDLAKSMAFYKARFADAGHFTFVFVGSFTVDMIKPFVETYVASLPATKAGETWRDLGITPPTGVVQKTVEKGIAPKSQVAIVFSGPFAYNDANLLALRTVTMVLQGPVVRHDPSAARWHLQHRGRAADAEESQAGVQRAHLVGVRPGSRRDARAARVRRDRLREAHGAELRPDDPRPRGAAARLGREQPEQRLSTQSDRAALRGR
jgi:zinc protease